MLLRIEGLEPKGRNHDIGAGRFQLRRQHVSLYETDIVAPHLVQAVNGMGMHTR